MPGVAEQQRGLLDNLATAKQALDQSEQLVPCSVCAGHIAEVSGLVGELAELADFAHDVGGHPETLRLMRKVLEVGDDLRLFNLLVRISRFFRRRRR